jgi:hypothetical protein
MSNELTYVSVGDNTQHPATGTRSRGIVGVQALYLVACVALVMLGGGLRWRVLPGFHPVLENADEIARMLNTMLVRHDQPPLAEDFGIYAFNPGYDYTGFPPVQLWVHAVVQRVVEAQIAFPVPADYVIAARYTSFGVALVTLVLMLWMGYELGRPLGRSGAMLASWLTGLGWAVGPVVVLVTNLGLADPLLYPFIPLAVIGMLRAGRDGQIWGAIVSLLCAIVAIYTKYALVYTLVFPAFAVVGLAWKHGNGPTRQTRLWDGLRALWPWVALMALISATTAGWLIFGNQMFALENRETRLFYDHGLPNALSPAANFVNVMGVILWTMGWRPFFTVLFIGLVAQVLNRRWGWAHLEGWVLASLALFVASGFMLITSVTIITDWDRARYTLAPLMGLLGVWGTLAATLVISGWRVLAERPVARWVVAIGIVTAIAAPVLAFAMTDNNEKAAKYAEPHIMAQVWRWSTGALNPPEGKILIIQGAERWQQYTWDRTNGGYDGDVAFGYVVDRDPDHQPPTAFWDLDIAYLVLSEGDLAADPALAAYTNDLLHLKTFASHPPSGAQTATHVYRMLPPQVAAAVTFDNGIALVGYDLRVTDDTVQFRPYWQATEPITANLSLFVHLHPADERTNILAQSDGPPATARRLTPSWTDADEVLVGQTSTLALPTDERRDDLVLSIGLYDPSTGLRVPLADGDEITLSLP